MTVYYPDHWCVIKMNYNGEVIYKILGAWSSSYLHGPSWRLNSGVEKIGYDSEEDMYEFVGHSGSVYKCHRDSYGMNLASMGAWNTMKEAHPDRVELLKDRKDWTNMLTETENV